MASALWLCLWVSLSLVVQLPPGEAIIVGTNGNLYIMTEHYVPIDPFEVYRNQEEFARLHGVRGRRLIDALGTNSYRLPKAGYGPTHHFLR